MEAKFTEPFINKVKDTSERQKIVATKKLCYSCLGERNRYISFKSKRSGKNCISRHHASICKKRNGNSTPTLATQNKQVIHPMVIVKVNEIKCRAFLGTGASSAYASQTLIEKINKNPSRTEYRNIEMITHTARRNIKI